LVKKRQIAGRSTLQECNQTFMIFLFLFNFQGFPFSSIFNFFDFVRPICHFCPNFQFCPIFNFVQFSIFLFPSNFKFSYPTFNFMTPCIFEYERHLPLLSLSHFSGHPEIFINFCVERPTILKMDRLEVKPRSSNRKSYFEVVQEDLRTGRQSHNQFEVLKQGSLEKYVYLKNGQKTERKRFSQKWTYCYAIMTENLFMTFKDHSASAM